MIKALSIGEELFEKGDIEGARNVFNTLLKETSNCADTHNNLGVLYWQTDDIQKAMDHFAEALEIDPNNRDVVVNCAAVLASQGDIENAAALYKVYLKSNPEDTEIYRLLSDVESRNNQQDVDNLSTEIEGAASVNDDSQDLYACTRDGIEKYNCEGIEKDKHFFFILGAPRSGTKWFSEFMTTDKVFCFHELSLVCHRNLEGHLNAMIKFKPIPQELVTLDSQLRRLFYMYPSFGRLLYHKIYESETHIACGNSDAALMYYSRALQQVFPGSKFLIILRNGFDVALSMDKLTVAQPFGDLLERRYEQFIHYLIRHYDYKCKDYFELMCWRWRIDTEWLLENARHLENNNFMMVSFEKIFSDINLLCKVWDFLTNGKVPFDQKRAISLLKKKVNIVKNHKPGGATIRERWNSLDESQRDSFMKIGGSFMKCLPGYEMWPELNY